MSRIDAFARRHGVDLLIVVAALATAVEVVVNDNGREADTSLWFAVPATTLVVLAVLGHRRMPFAAPATLWLLAAALSFADGRLVPSTAGVFAAGLVAAFLLGQVRDPVQGRLGLGVVLGSAAIIVYNSPNNSPGDFIFTPAVFAIAWLAGFALRERAVRAEAAEERATFAERERDAAARVAVAEERARIARELHDIVAHAVSVMVLQIGAVRHRLPEEAAEDRETLVGVERTGREALAEMRRLLGAMRRDSEDVELAPQPGLGSLDSLVEAFGRAGLPVGLRVEGEHEPLPGTLDLSAYRIVQEGLTNTLKHAHASRADVVIRFEPDKVKIDIRDDGDGPSTTDGLGHGLVGVRERVKIYGGEMTAGRGRGGGFLLSTSLPLEGSRR
jgi:signal transduction histidine kinase